MSKGRAKLKERILQSNIAAEICLRESSKSREVNISDVSRVLRHFFEILSEKDYGDRAYFIDNRIKYYGRKQK